MLFFFFFFFLSALLVSHPLLMASWFFNGNGVVTYGFLVHVSCFSLAVAGLPLFFGFQQFDSNMFSVLISISFISFRSLSFLHV